MGKKDRICMFCEHLNIEYSEMGSEWTGRYGEDGFSCGKAHFDEYGEGCVNTVNELRELFKKAATCEDYLQQLDDSIT